MAMKNKYAKRATISEAKIREIVRYVAADLTALQAAALSGLNRNTVNRLYGACGSACCWPAKPSAGCSYPGRRGRRELLRRRAASRAGGARRLRQDRRLRHRSGRATSIPRSPDCSKPTLQGIIRVRVDPRTVINSDGCSRLPRLGPTSAMATSASDHARDEFTKGTVHINGIEGFWGLAQGPASIQGPADTSTAPSQCATEYGGCYNHRRADKYKCLLQYLRKNPAQLGMTLHV